MIWGVEFMKKTIIIVVGSLVVISIIVCGLYNYFTVDTQYAKQFGNILSDYNIEQTDGFFEDSTKIISGDRESTYRECRQNVIKAFEEKKFCIQKDTSYGHGNNRFKKGSQEVLIRLFGTYNDKTIGECSVIMKLKRNNLLNYSIESIESDSKFFDYLFFGNK